MWGLSSVNIVARCAVNPVNSILVDMTKTIQQLNYAVQRLNADFDEWDTIRETITPSKRAPVGSYGGSGACAPAVSSGLSN